jgi:hypothetical protein
MSIGEYFRGAKGIGVLATSDADGKVNAAIYARPYANGEQTVSFIMGDRRSRANLASNPKAAYLFKEEKGFGGKRLYLTKIDENEDPRAVQALRDSGAFAGRPQYPNESKAVVTFAIDEVRPLVGDDEE